MALKAAVKPDGVNIGFNCEVFSASRVTIGRMVLMAAYSYVIGGDQPQSEYTPLSMRRVEEFERTQNT